MPQLHTLVHQTPSAPVDEVSPALCTSWSCPEDRYTCTRHCRGRLSPEAPIGELVLTSDLRTFLAVDRVAQKVLEMPESHLPYEKRPAPQMLDAYGRPYLMGTAAPVLASHRPYVAVRALRWAPDAPWRWVKYVATLDREVPRVNVLVQRTAPREVHAFTCANCHLLTTAVGTCAGCGRNYCSACLNKHPCPRRRYAPAPDPRPRCPVNGTLLLNRFAGALGPHLREWCTNKRLGTGRPCWPECEFEEARQEAGGWPASPALPDADH